MATSYAHAPEYGTALVKVYRHVRWWLGRHRYSVLVALVLLSFVATGVVDQRQRHEGLKAGCESVTENREALRDLLHGFRPLAPDGSQFRSQIDRGLGHLTEPSAICVRAGVQQRK